MSAADMPSSAFTGLGLSSSTIEILKSPPKSPASAAAPNVLHAEPIPARDLEPNESAITLYAEVLLHIRTVTLFASLRTNKNHTTRATLSTDGYAISVSHEDETASIRLPIKAKGGRNDATLDLPASPDCKELSLRLQIAEEAGSDLFSGFRSEERKANLVPWDGASLNDMKGAKAACKRCGEVVLQPGKVKEWRDLPNENWAEMMDFWHCHKPDEHHLHDHKTHETVAKKGYAAGSKLSAVAGVGFVDLDSILLKEEDCTDVQLSPSNEIQNSVPASRSELLCTQCKAVMGVHDVNASGHRLWKWAVNITSTPSKPAPGPDAPSTLRTYTTQKWISARLLFLIENLGIRKFHVYTSSSPPTPPPANEKDNRKKKESRKEQEGKEEQNGDDDKEKEKKHGLLLWVFTPDLYFSSSLSAETRRDPTRAMKIFWQPKPFAPKKPGEREEVGVEEVEMPAPLYEDLESALGGSGKLLPTNARVFQGWSVGLLGRFDVGEI